MAIYDDDGTATRENGKLYDNDGTTSYQIGKAYDNDGTSNHLIYSAEYDVLAAFGWTKAGTSSYITSLTATNVTIKPTAGSGNARVYKTIDVTNYRSMTITCSLSALHSYATCGLYASDPGYLVYNEPTVGKQVRDSNGSTQTVNGTFTFDISSLSGIYYVVIGAYQGSGASPVATCTKFILE